MDYDGIARFLWGMALVSPLPVTILVFRLMRREPIWNKLILALIFSALAMFSLHFAAAMFMAEGMSKNPF